MGCAAAAAHPAGRSLRSQVPTRQIAEWSNPGPRLSINYFNTAAIDPNTMFLAINGISPKTSGVGRVTPIGFCDRGDRQKPGRDARSAIPPAGGIVAKRFMSVNSNRKR